MFHAHAIPNKLFALLTTSVRFSGVLMDISHARYQRYSKDTHKDNASNTAAGYAAASGAEQARQRWAAYNRLRGQYASALEHAIPERFFNDSTQCNSPGHANPDPNKPACAEGVSAVKAIAIAASEGQKVYSINKDNLAATLPLLNHSQSIKETIANAAQAGQEVTVHEMAINKHGFRGAGLVIVNPETGFGGYLIEGGSRGAYLEGLQLGMALAMTLILFGFTLPVPPLTAIPAYMLIIVVGDIVRHYNKYSGNPDDQACFIGGLTAGLAGVLGVAAGLVFGAPGLAVLGFVQYIISLAIPSNTPSQCGIILL
jgi:hypothetical protein